MTPSNSASTPSNSDTRPDSVMGGLTDRQITLLRDVRRMGFMAFFDSRCRSEGPALRDMGMIGGVGDSTGLTAAGLAAVKEADSSLRKQGGAA